MDKIKGDGDSTGIRPVSFSFSDFRVLNSFYDEGVKDNTVKPSLGKEGKEIDVIATRGFFANEDRVFREVREPFYEGIKALDGHGEFFFKEGFFWAEDSRGIEAILGDINTDKDLEVIHGSISLRKEAEKGICQPILHDNEGFEAQPTYHGYGRVATNSYEGLIAQVKWSCPSLPAFYPGKTRAYKVYNTDYS